MKKIIKNISLRARVAFIILCIENALEKLVLKDKIQKTLNVFWHQTSIEFVDEWLYEVSKVMSDSILCDDYEENDVLTHKDYLYLKESYKSIPKFVFELMECAFECGTIELYGMIDSQSEKTIQIVLKTIQIMEQNSIPLPDMNLFEKFPITENNGWGRAFTREDIFNESNG